MSLPTVLSESRHKYLPKLFRKMGFKTGVEIGTLEGRYAKTIMLFNPQLKLTCVDPWINYRGYEEVHDEKNYEKALERLKKYNCELVRDFSMNVVKRFKDNSLDFVFIDGNHSYKYALEDICEWSKKVRPGGIVSGHDYENSSVCQVEDAVNLYVREQKIEQWYVLTGDKHKTFYWVKQ